MLIQQEAHVHNSYIKLVAHAHKHSHHHHHAVEADVRSRDIGDATDHCVLICTTNIQQELK